MSDTNDKVLPIIGLEIHVELATETKMFCRCRNSFGDAPNTNICPVCLGMPGSLPVMNKKAVALSIKVGLALNCKIAEFTKWDRKHYYYPDLPKNYQITQYDMPLSENGYMDAPLEDGTTHRIRVLRAHLEEDAGKNVHDNPGYTGVDLNRAGLPLLEIVSEPDMNDVGQVLAYAKSMHRLVRWLGVAEANMQMGQMRFEPNINLHITRDGKTYKTPIIEVKNLNSFKALENSVQYEIQRQHEQWLADPDGFTIEKLGKQNRGYDDASQRTVFQRSKELAHDYRYFPEPDLVPVTVDSTWLESITETIAELPIARRNRYMEQYKLTFTEADALTMDDRTGVILDQAVSAGAKPKRCANLLLSRGAAIANERGCAIGQIGINPQSLAELAIMLQSGKVNATAGAKIFDKMIAQDASPEKIADDDNLLAVTDDNALAQWVDQAIADNPIAVSDVKSGGKKQKKAFGYLMGQVMQKSRSTADPAGVNKILKEKLSIDN